LKIFRCKYCQCAYPNRKETLYHEVREHKVTIKLNQYYGPENLQLEEDFLNQIEKLSWPFKKRRHLKKPQSSELVGQADVSANSIPLPKSRKRLFHDEVLPLGSKILPSSESNPAKKRRMPGPKSKTYPILKQSLRGNSLSVDSKVSSNLGSLHGKKKLNEPTRKSSLEQSINDHQKLYFENQCKYCKCDLNSPSPKDFLKHLNAKQCNNVTLFTCSLCREDFSCKRDMFDEHKKNCFMTRFFTQEVECGKCNKLFGSSSLEDHLVERHITLFRCFLCSAEFNQKECLSDHLQRCTFEPTVHRTFTCETCREHFKSLKSLKTHFLLEHTNHYLNSDISLDYSHTFEWVENKKACNLLQYQIDNYIACNSKGSFFCGIKDCKKVLNTIFELETHIVGHCEKVKKKTRVKKRGKKKKITKESTVSFYRTISICDDYLMKNRPVELPALVEENVDIKPKDQFLSGLDLKQNNVGNCEPCALDIETILKDYDLDNSQQDSQGIFELTDMAKYSTQDSHIWQISEQIRPKVPLVVTIDSDDD
jgi:Uncharacterized conserved protein, contains RING Zn-finger